MDTSNGDGNGNGDGDDNPFPGFRSDPDPHDLRQCVINTVLINLITEKK